MDKNKKEKIVAIVITSLISLAASVIGCLLGISPDAQASYVYDTAVTCNSAIVYTVDV